MKRTRWNWSCILVLMILVSLVMTDSVEAKGIKDWYKKEFQSVGDGIAGLAAPRSEQAAERAGYTAWINIVEDYKADNTGKKNISALVNQAIAENPGATIYFPAGDYRITKPIIYERPANEEVYNDQIRMGCAFRGEGTGQTVFHLDTAEGKSALNFRNGDGVRLSDITFVNENTNDRNMILVTEHAWDFSVVDCEFYNCVKGIEVENGGYSYIRDCLFFSAGRDCEYMVLQSFDIETAVADTNEYIYVENCIFEGEADAAVQLEALKYGTVFGCTFMNNSGCGIRLTSETGDSFNHMLDANVYVNLGTGIYLNPTNYYISRVSVSNSYFANVSSVLRLKKGDCNYDGDLDFYGCTISDSELITTNAELKGYFELYEESSAGLDTTTSYSSRKKKEIRAEIYGEDGDLTGAFPGYYVTDSNGNILREYEDYVGYRTSQDTYTIIGVGSFTGIVTVPWMEKESTNLPVYNLVECGGDNLGQEDVSGLINRILNQNKNQRFILYIPRGNYRLDSQIMIDNSSREGVIFMGEGKDKTLFRIHYDALKGASPIRINHGQDVELNGFQMLPMDVNTEEDASAPMIDIWDGQNIRITELCMYAYLPKHLGIYLENGNQALIRQCNFNRHNSSETEISCFVLLSGGRYNEVSDCAFEGKYSTADGTGLVIQYEDGIMIRNTDFCNWYGGDAILIRNGAHVDISNSVFMRNKSSIRQIGDPSSAHMRSIAVWTGDLSGSKYILKSEGEGMNEVRIQGMFVSSNKARIESNALASASRCYIWYDTKLNSDLEDPMVIDQALYARWIKGKKTSYKLKPDTAGDYKLQIFNRNGEKLKKGTDYTLKKKSGYWLIKGKGDYSGTLYLKYSK